MIEGPQTSKLNSIAYVLLTALICECVIGSSGRWFELGSLSIRMIIFIIAAVMTIPYIIKNLSSLIKNKVIQSILVLCLFICFSTVYGYIKGNNSGYVAADLTSFLFLLIIPCYIVVCNTQRRVEKLVKYAAYASLVLAIVTIVFHFVFLFISRAEEEEINYVINGMGLGGFFGFGDGIYRIYFKSSVCFILPFLYNLNKVISDNEDKKRHVLPYVFMSLSLIAVVLTYTRSVWFGVLIAVIAFMLINLKKFKKLIKGVGIAAAGFLVFVLISWASYGFEGVITNAVNRVLLPQEDKAMLQEDFDSDDPRIIQVSIQVQSDNIREERLQAVYKQIKNNWVFGCGFGQELKVRNYGGKIEYTYLDILSKMGVFGFMSFLLVLLLPFFYVLRKYKLREYRTLTGVMLCVMVCIYMASIFNPYITSPIGFSLFAVTIASIYALQSGRAEPVMRDRIPTA